METPPEKHAAAPGQRKIWKTARVALIVLIVGVLLAAGVYQIPAVHERAYYYVATLRSKIFYFFKPPASTAFEPLTEQTADPTATLAVAPAETQTPAPTLALEEPTATPTLIPTLVPTAIPAQVFLGNIVLEPQSFNNCGPATLSMALNYWGWEGKQHNIQPIMKPRIEDLAVTTAEMIHFVETETDLDVLIRYGGDIEIIKRFVAAGFPVLIERGYFVPSDGWMGHFGVINGYDDAAQTVHIPDSFSGVIDMRYEDLELYWAHFYNTFLVIYPPEMQELVFHLLGEYEDPEQNLAFTIDLETERIQSLTGREQFFAQYNLGTLKLMQGNYQEAAEAYDLAFGLYKNLYTDERPWRLVWYEPGPYEAYYQMGRYQDVINLADKTINETPSKGLPETYLWRGRAELRLGNQETAVYDFKRALQWHPQWQPALDELQALGVAP